MLELSNITKVYNQGIEPVNALRGVTLTIAAGEYLAIMGASGSGKSTLMHIIGLLDKPTSGRYVLQGRDVQGLDEDELASLRNKTIGFVFQQFNLLPTMTALENVMLPLAYAKVGKEARLTRARACLELVGLEDRFLHRPNQLSGGQQQRVSIARALVNEPRLILADEPTGALDSQTSLEIMALLKMLHDQGITIVLVTHEGEIASYAKRLIRLKDGCVLSDTVVSQI